jgi:hypothetical protein|tara:strand:- start:63 stop:695 length:633 start_codon:yes stop_codon:yes gene_type:complete
MSIVTYNNRSIANITTVPGAAKSLTHIKTLTASGDSTLSFVHGSSDVVLDSTYPIYVFKFINCHTNTNERNVVFKGSIDAGSNYNVTQTTTVFRARNFEDGSTPSLQYETAHDTAQGTGGQGLAGDTSTGNMGSGSDESMSGELMLFNPSSTTFVKHYISRVNYYHSANLSVDTFIAGYFNTTSDIDAIQFAASGGNFDGTIKLYGLKDS